MNGFERRRNEKKEQILRAARYLIYKKGLEKTSIREIAEVANVSKVSIFNFFGSKEELARTVFERFMDWMAKEHQEILNDNISFAESVEKVLKLQMQLHEMTSPPFYESLLTFFQGEGSMYMEYYSKKGMDKVKRLLDKGRREGVIDPAYDDKLLFLYFHIFSEGMRSPKIRDKVDQNTGALIQLFLRGLKP